MTEKSITKATINTFVAYTNHNQFPQKRDGWPVNYW
jgi:hypothetical protein